MRIVSFGGVFKFSEFCEAVGILYHFSLLAEFSWMTVMSFQSCHSFYLASQMVPVSGKNEKLKLFAYLIVGWGIPSIIVGISVVINYTMPGLVQYGPLVQYVDTLCLFNHASSTLVAFWLPLIVSILLQVILFSVSLYFLCASSLWKIKKNTPYFRIVVAMFFCNQYGVDFEFDWFVCGG